MHPTPVPKIELHVHLEGTVRPAALFEMAARNGHPLPVGTEAELDHLYAFRDFEHFLDLWATVTPVIRRHRDFRQVVNGLCGRGCLPWRRVHRRHLHPCRAHPVVDSLASGRGIGYG